MEASRAPPPITKRPTVGRLKIVGLPDQVVGDRAGDGMREQRSVGSPVEVMVAPPPVLPPRAARVRLAALQNPVAAPRQVAAQQQRSASGESAAEPGGASEDAEFAAARQRHSEAAAALEPMAAAPKEPPVRAPSTPVRAVEPVSSVLGSELHPSPMQLKAQPTPASVRSQQPDGGRSGRAQTWEPAGNDLPGASSAHSDVQEREREASEVHNQSLDAPARGGGDDHDGDDRAPPVSVASVVKAVVALFVLCIDLATAVVLAFCWWVRTSPFSLGYGLIFGYLVILRPARYDSSATAWRVPRGWPAAFLNAALSTVLHIIFAIVDLFDGFGDAEARNAVGRRFVDLGLLPMVHQSRVGFMLPDLVIVVVLGCCAVAHRLVVTRRRREQQQAALKRRERVRSLARTWRKTGASFSFPESSGLASAVVHGASVVQEQHGDGGNLRKRTLRGSQTNAMLEAAVQIRPNPDGQPHRQRPEDKHRDQTDINEYTSPSDVPSGGQPEADTPLKRLSSACAKTRGTIVAKLVAVANQVRNIWRKEFKTMAKLTRVVPLRYVFTRFIRDGVAVLCVATALYDTTIFAFPYIVMPGVYVQLWIHSSSLETKRRADKIVAHFALFDLVTAYLSDTETIGQPMRDVVAAVNELSWLETNEPKWDYTSCALRMWILVGYSFINLVPMKDIEQLGSASTKQLSSTNVFERHSVRFAHLLAEGEEDQTRPFYTWLQGSVLISGFVLCSILWSVLAVTPTSLPILILAWFTVVWYKRFQVVSKYVVVCVQVIVFLQWCVGSGLRVPFIADVWTERWQPEARKQVAIGVIATGLLSAWSVHHSGPGSEKYHNWLPHMKTLHKIHSFRKTTRAVVIVILNICGLGQASGIHTVYVVAGRLFQITESLQYKAWIALASFAYMSIGAGLTWHLLFPPVYPFGGCTELVAAHNCSTPMSTLAPYLPDNEYVRDECEASCSISTTSSSVRDVAKVDRGGWQEIGIHACSPAADCRFASFGWSTVVAVAVSLQIGIWNFSGEHKVRFNRKIQQHEVNKKRPAHELSQEQHETMEEEEEYTTGHSATIEEAYRTILRFVSVIIMVWAFAITHSTSKPRVDNAWIFSTVLVFCLAGGGRRTVHHPAQHRLLWVLWTFLSAIIILVALLKYFYTLQFARTAMNTLFINRLRLNQTIVVSVNGTQTIVRYSGFLDDDELGLIDGRTFAQQIMFFILVINGVFAYSGVTNFEKMYLYEPRVKNEPEIPDKEHQEQLKKTSSNVVSFLKAHLSWSKLKMLAASNSPKLVLFIAYRASQVDPLKVIYAGYLLPVAVLLCFGPKACKRVWHGLSVYACLAWMATYTWQFKFCRSLQANDIWGLAVIDDMWDERLLVHIWVLISVAVYRALWKSQRLSRDNVSTELLFDGAWPHLSSEKLDTSDDPWLRLKFVASHFLLAFGQTIFFTTCLLAATFRRDNFSILYVLNLSVFFLKNRTKILKGMQINFVFLVVVQILVCGAALAGKIFDQYSVVNLDFPGGDSLVQVMDAFLYFSRNDNDASATVVDESLNGTSFAILFVMSSILYNEKNARALVKRYDQMLLAEEDKAKGENYHRAWTDGMTGEQRLLDTIERLCFIYSIQLDRNFKHLDQVKINDTFEHACSLDEFVARVKQGLGKKLKKHIKDDSELTDLLRKLGRSVPWVCPRVNTGEHRPDDRAVDEISHGSPRNRRVEERVFWLRFCTHVSADIQDRMLTWSVHQAIDDNGEEPDQQAKAEHLFKRFDTDSNGYLDLEEHKHMHKILEGDDTEASTNFDQEYVRLCKRVHADPTRGLNMDQFICMYEGNLAQELDSDLTRDYNHLNAIDRRVKATHSPIKRLLWSVWTAVLVAAVDCMALVIGMVCLLYRDSFSLIMGGYLAAALSFLRVQRSQHDFDMLQSLHKYTFMHIMAQSLFLFLDPLLGLTETESRRDVLVNLIGLEPKTATYSVSVYTLAAWLFAWIIAVSELQKSEAYSTMRVNKPRVEAIARVHLFISFATRMLDRHRGMGRIEKIVTKLEMREKHRDRSRRGSTVFSEQNNRRLSSSKTLQGSRLTHRKAMTAGKGRVQEITTAKFRSCTVFLRNIPSVASNKAELVRIVTAELARDRHTFHWHEHASWTYFIVQVTIHHSGQDSKTSWALITFSNEKVAQALAELSTIATSSTTAPIAVEHLDYDKGSASEGAFLEVWRESKAKAEVRLEHRLWSRTKGSRGHPDLREWAKDRQRQAKPLHQTDAESGSLVGELSEMLGLSRFAPKRLAAGVIMARKKHTGMRGKDALAELAGSSATEQVAIYVQDVIVTNSQRMCYVMILVNQWVNSNLFSAVYFVALMGCVMCEDPHVPPGFWEFMVFCLQAEITLRYVLSIPFLGVLEDCEEYKTRVQNNAEIVTGSSSPFICQAFDPSDRIEILLVLMVCVLIHEYRMKRLGMWLSWSPFVRHAEETYRYHKRSLHRARDGSLKAALETRFTKVSQDSESKVTGSYDDNDADDTSKDGHAVLALDEEQPLPPDTRPDDDASHSAGTPVDQNTEPLDASYQLDHDDDGEPLQPFEQVVVKTIAFKLRFAAFLGSFYSNVLLQDQMLPIELIDDMKRQYVRIQKLQKTTEEEVMPMRSPLLENKVAAPLFRKSLHKIPVDLYPPSMLVEFLSMGLVAFGLDKSLSSVELTSISSFIDGDLIWMTMLQFAFIVLDRAANLRQSIPFKFCLQWLSLIVYMPMIFAVWDWNGSLAIMFALKCIYWMLGAIQIRKGYPVDTSMSSNSSWMSELHPIRHYWAVLLHAIPFVDYMRTALRWVFNETTMDYEDCVRFDEIMGIMYIIRCKFARADELQLEQGQPQRASTKLWMGSFLLLQFCVYMWGPMIVITFMDDIVGSHLNNVRSASLQMDLYIGGTPIPVFETKYAAVSGIVPGRTPQEHIPTFVAPGYPDSTQSEYYSNMGTTLCQELFEAAMRRFDPYALYHTRCESGSDDTAGDIFSLFSADAFETLQVVQFGQFSDTTWSPSIQRMTTSRADLNKSEVAVRYVLRFDFDTPNNTVTPPPRQETGTMHGKIWEEDTLCTPMNPQCDGQCSLQQAWNLTDGQGNRDVLRLMFSEHPSLLVPTPATSTLCVPGGGYTPLLYLSKDAEQQPKPMGAEQGMAPHAKFCICMVADMAEDRRVWQLLQAYGPGGTLITEKPRQDGDGVSASQGLAVLADSQKIPTGVGQSVASFGLVGLYVTVVFNMARGLKLAREKLLRELVYSDRDAANFVYDLCQEIEIARKFAKLDPDWFKFEDKKWLELQSYLRDQRELLKATQQAKEARERALDISSDEDGGDSDDDESILS